MDAIGEARTLEQRAKDVALKTVEAELDGGYGVFAGKHPHVATLIFSADSAQWVAREEWRRVVRSLLSDLVDRGLDADRARLWMMDGSKAMRKAIVECFGALASSATAVPSLRRGQKATR